MWKIEEVLQNCFVFDVLKVKNCGSLAELLRFLMLPRSKIEEVSQRQTDRQAGRQADRQTGRQADREAERQTARQTNRQTGRQAARQPGSQAGRQTDNCNYNYNYNYHYTTLCCSYNYTCKSKNITLQYATQITPHCTNYSTLQ